MIKNKKGFTLIELIIVMAIIGILAVVAIVAISGKSADARDARRLADMSAVRTAFALNCAEQSTTTVTVTSSAATTTPLVSGTAATSYMTFTNIVDPTGTNACTPTIAGVCNYAYGLDTNGGALTSDTTHSIDTCNYWINFYLEGDADEGSARDEGLVTP